jgi:hypothetical protein
LGGVEQLAKQNKECGIMAGFFNWASWVAVGDIANVGQLTGVNAIQLIAMVIKAANNARMHKKNCRQFAQHLKLISGLLEQLNLTDLKRRPECREPLELLEQALRKAVILVESCRDKSYLYLVAMGWVYVTKFRDYQDEIDRYLKLIPLISLVETSRVSSNIHLFHFSPFIIFYPPIILDTQSLKALRFYSRNLKIFLRYYDQSSSECMHASLRSALLSMHKFFQSTTAKHRFYN